VSRSSESVEARKLGLIRGNKGKVEQSQVKVCLSSGNKMTNLNA